jgi:hypothetical protein
MSKKKAPRVVEYRTKTNWYLCWVVAIKPEGILEVQIPNPGGLAWRVDLWPNEYKVLA